MLRVEGATLFHGGYRALDGVSLAAEAGELVVLLGANGAGKSSLFLALSGLYRLRSGSIRLDGTEIGGRSPAQIVRAGLVQCPEGRKLFPGMSVLKNLRLGAYARRADAATLAGDLERVFALFPMLAQKRDQPAGSLSGGQQQMVAVGRALMGRPRLLLLDEPSLGLAPLVVKEVMQAVHEINQAGTTVLLAEQNAYAALRIAHRGYVLEGGRVVMAGSSAELLGDERIRRAYVGA